ncbi:MAG TPA: DNA-binding protein [Candidatus Marinimicrobia bacterium]|nr:DNA-binding protein [Candidatus Neomarinimicrobiota bacterium]
MKKLLLIISIFCWSSICFSQEKTANIQIFTSEFERIEIVRLRSGMDLLEGLKEAVSSRKIKNGVILAGIGAVTDYHYHVVSSKNLPPDEEYPKASVPMDLISVQGYILNGRVHAHIALSDANSVVGGHLESGTKALTFFIITIGVLPDSLKIDNLDNYKY